MCSSDLRALSLEGTIDTSRTRQHRHHALKVAADPVGSTHVLRVQLVPERADGLDIVVGFDFGDAGATALHVRNSVAVPLPADAVAAARATVRCTAHTWAEVLGGRTTLTDALASGSVVIDGDRATALLALGAFDVDGLQP